ncbi:class I SAM-dependent methyltransferase [Spongiactinospora sp. TRM90649]|uniref:methyltransferase domain-containing protein n=1 Tax=Spongiactinospora sp. TRM90649 TaxID=3031114 RepID=UPI0023F9418B|nr:class I SAM-dependent methyltransferase [Spongiactinospora sp. TRM90649]MDF5754797.1 class I SAM-dependent methyltransferase [Spongiactinospora sp. TRM90649]
MYEVTSGVERDDLFNRIIRDQWTEHLGRRIDVLAAGCGRGGDPLTAPRMETRVTGIDEDLPALRRVVESRPDLDAFALGDLRLVPVPPRAFDVVHIDLVLERIRHAELVLDRLIAGLRPGGLLLLRMRDRESAYGFWDRVVPTPLRRLTWRRFTPSGTVGPLPAVYETITSRDGVRSFCLSRGLRISEEHTACAGPALRGTFGGLARLACRLVHSLSGGRRTAAHDEITFVIRKPQNQFARLI